jgi:hypothetical protein
MLKHRNMILLRGDDMWNCENTMDKICFVVAIIGMVAGMFACGYIFSMLLKCIGASVTIQVLSGMVVTIFVGYSCNRFETIIKR